MAMAAPSLRAVEQAFKAVVLLLILTMIFGTVFLVVKYFEYQEKWGEHLVPGINFQYYQSAIRAQGADSVLPVFRMTGMHALHMIVGLGLLTYLVVKAKQKTFSANYYTPVEMIGLYWHFVDVVWIFLFPLLYLIGHRR